jgi:hypothetical protein
MKSYVLIWILLTSCLFTLDANAQIVARERPDGWGELVYGGRFMDRFLAMRVQGELTSNTWGADNVKPRYTDNGLEDNEWSYWGGNAVLGTDGKYHLYVCRWREDSQRGHMEWHNSIVVHAVADIPTGPYKVKDTIGPGHNPEVFQLKDGRYVIYVMGGYYIGDSVDGPWQKNKFEFNKRDRRIIEGLSNLSFARREDGSFLMVCRGGGIWFSESGISSYNQVTDKRVYPPVAGNFEDPVVWRTPIQYHMIVNDWRGRIAYYLRSKDGISWKVDPGEAYMPGIAKYQDGTVVDWFKYKKKINSRTRTIRVKIAAEDGFNPHTDIDLYSLRFGASEEVNFGRGCKVLKTKRSGNDLIVTFDGTGNGITDDNFAAKLLGKNSSGKLLYGYARLPWLNYLEPALSACMPKIDNKKDGFKIAVEVQNFGQVSSEPADIKIVYSTDDRVVEVTAGAVGSLKPFQKTTVELTCGKIFEAGVVYNLKVIINPDAQYPVTLEGQTTPLP